MPEAAPELVVVKVAENEVEAEILRQVLVDAGVRAMVRSVDPMLGRGVFMPAPFSVEVLVWEEDLERARLLLGLEERPRRRYRRW